jgi:hypothetical protein
MWRKQLIHFAMTEQQFRNDVSILRSTATRGVRAFYLRYGLDELWTKDPEVKGSLTEIRIFGWTSETR